MLTWSEIKLGIPLRNLSIILAIRQLQLVCNDISTDIYVKQVYVGRVRFILLKLQVTGISLKLLYYKLLFLFALIIVTVLLITIIIILCL
jgi:hypothetical protein